VRRFSHALILARSRYAKKTYTGDGTCNEHYAFGAHPSLPPADATVLKAENNSARLTNQSETDWQKRGGNHVILDLGQGEYAMLAHFKKEA